MRRDDGHNYDEHGAQLMKAAGVEEPTPEQRQRFDQKRKKSLSNLDWVNPHDPEAWLTKMKDGRTHLAYKAEQVVDLDTGAVVALGIQPGDQGDNREQAGDAERGRERSHHHGVGRGAGRRRGALRRRFGDGPAHRSGR